LSVDHLTLTDADRSGVYVLSQDIRCVIGYLSDLCLDRLLRPLSADRYAHSETWSQLNIPFDLDTHEEWGVE
jgi:hypothetical protein